MNTQNVYILEDRGILFINGADTKEFLQNMISNDINKVNEDNSCFASLLSPQGKFLFALIIAKHKSGYFMDCEKSQTEALFKQLSIYKLRSKVEIMNLSNEFVIAAFNRDKFLKFEGANMSEVFSNISKSSIKLLNSFFELYPNIEPQEQEIENGFYLKRRTYKDSELQRIDFVEKDLLDIYNSIRCLTDPYPNAFIKDNEGNKLVFTGIKYIKNGN